MTTDSIARLEAELNAFAPAVRARALAELLSLAGRGAITLAPEADVANMHCHTFFSFNAYGYSPTSLAWLARRRGFRLAGIVDFDVMDGVDEFLDACEAAGVRGSAGIETRISIPEYAADEINSPGEPGVCYHMGIGLTSSSAPASVAGLLDELRQLAARRNRDVIGRVNPYLAPATIDYEQDVVPLTPAGNPTERHIVVAYIHAAERLAPNPVAFWADRLGSRPEETAAIMADSSRFQNLIRAKLMKQGGVGYVRPESGMFPLLEAFHRLIVACGALPCAAWLDGTSAAEQAIEGWLGFLVDKGVAALNIIPDRNWNIADPAIRRLKVRNLHRVVELAREMDLPLNVGTEMNGFGQKLVDGFDAPELAPLRQAFLDGACFVYGHTALQRALGLGYQSDWAQHYLPTRRARNEFYTRIGRAVPPGKQGLARLRRLDPASSPDEALGAVEMKD